MPLQQLQSFTLNLYGNGLGPEKPALSDCCDWQHLRLNSPTAHFVGMESVDGSIYASAVSLPNTTTEDPLTGAYVASSFGIFNATTQTGSIEMGLLTTGIVIISSTGDEECIEACPEEGLQALEEPGNEQVELLHLGSALPWLGRYHGMVW